MQKYFNVRLEFDHVRIHNTIKQKIKSGGKGYICMVDSNVLTIAQKDKEYRLVLNQAMVNACDGSSIAAFCGLIHGERFTTLSGPDIFEIYIQKPYKNLLLGSTEEIVNKLQRMMLQKGLSTDNIKHISLPFKPVEEFDYRSIARQINQLGPDLIWVSLGAPKQEKFIKKIMPYLNRGILFGVGAAFNFYIGEIRLSAYKMGAFSFTWSNRLLHEPVKIGKRILPYLLLLPKLCWNEYRKVHLFLSD